MNDEMDPTSSADVGIARAFSWLETEGRALDLAELNWALGNPSDPLLAALGHYANPDGGFGNALEPDVRLPGSSVLATTVGLQLLAGCDAARDHPLVAGALTYLESTFDDESWTWPIVPPNVVDAPRAPWWDPRSPERNLVNPRAEIIGYLYRWPGFFDDDRRDQMAEELVARLIGCNELQMHDLLTYDRLLGSPGLPSELHQRAWSKFEELALAAIIVELAAWGEYGLTPLTVVKAPDHPLAERLSDAIGLNLDHLMATQQADGSWAPTWSWYGSYPDDWPTAEHDIRSRLTAENLALLTRFGRILGRPEPSRSET